MIKYKDLLHTYKYQSWTDIDSTNTYWSLNGKHQEKYDTMRKANFEFSKTAVSLFHRYYRFFNDGDCPASMKHLVVDYSKYLEEKVDNQIEKEWHRYCRYKRTNY